MIVVDASALVEVLLRTHAAPPITERIFEEPGDIAAPHLIDVEVAHVIRGYVLRGQVAPDRGREALEDLADFSLERSPHTFSLPRVWDLRDNLSAYDASYVVLAEVLRAPLVTCDQRLCRVVRASSHLAIELIEHTPSVRSQNQ
jgi:predicted nucleic acid-binding protein